ncbi:hypothetical protein NBRC10512v2_002373 [Rhodotorula toruloides]|uniref:Protein CPL1-like domain-containing protein n=1 Tax=Rhodotorula toruloides (strain NP11) TaxID=1130832 RepID=M7XZF4_RHOT1|nr:uncharacterized protein RHTO_00136 [Rhodotorula toruloides NP11]EMS25708.1 hypothetical protein RHTO_00136 [Rhodotorula toruloides NP11]
MRTVFAVASVATLASVATAQSITGYGRFSCTTFVGGVPTAGTLLRLLVADSAVGHNGLTSLICDADQSLCTGLVSPGTGLGGGAQGDSPAPVGATCSLEIETGNYFCGIAGAPCTASTHQGGFTQACANNDANCSGYLYCTSQQLTPTVSGTCGGLGAFCQDYTVGSTTLTDAQNEVLFNQFCQSGYCGFLTGNCETHALLGQDCSFDPEFACATGLTCTTDTTTGAQTCTIASASARARTRARRSGDLARRNVCPSSHSACTVPGAKGFECIDTSSNIEQCGACASEGGVDCTQIEGAAAVGCVAGVCEIWSCAEGFTYNEAKGACIA